MTITPLAHEGVTFNSVSQPDKVKQPWSKLFLSWRGLGMCGVVLCGKAGRNGIMTGNHEVDVTDTSAF